MDDSRASGVVVCCAGILISDGRVLLGKRTSTRSAYPNVWDVPGGRSEAGELLEETLIRELEEELGIRAIHPTYHSKLQITGNSRGLECHLFLVAAWEGVPINRAPDEHSEIGWFTMEEVLRLDLATSAYLPIFRPLLS